MSQFDNVIDDVVETASIELERMFTVLTNVYHPTEFADHARLLPHVETRLKASLKELRQTAFESLATQE